MPDECEFTESTRESDGDVAAPGDTGAAFHHVPGPSPAPSTGSEPEQGGRAGRWWAGAFVAAVAAVSVLAVAQPVSAATSGGGGEDPAARAAVVELTGAHPAAVEIPAGFAAEHGYRPVVRGGLLVDPLGACSSPVPLPAEFVTACRAHDLGYDMLRYADDRGRPLGPWARQAVDAVLDRRMHAACDHRHGLDQGRCQVMASVASTAVDLNSRRQNYAAPRPEYLFGARLSGKRLGHQLLAVGAPASLVLAALALLMVELVRRKRQRVTASGASRKYQR
ncbi:hypothetical protein [Nocardia sp. GAS34]|uniref:hypothetical protein n=1 Tax=unclassified Nocardia TaxID=2637762 RepID=UPI003D254597